MECDVCTAEYFICDSCCVWIGIFNCICGQRIEFVDNDGVCNEKNVFDAYVFVFAEMNGGGEKSV